MKVSNIDSKKETWCKLVFKKLFNCSNCNKILFLHGFRAERGSKNVYCNKHCKWEFEVKENHHGYNGGKIVICANCGKEFYVAKFRTKSKKIFCSKTCANTYMVGENSSNWKGGKTQLVNEIRNSDEYKKWRLDVFEKDSFCCKLCGYNKGKLLEAHHKIHQKDIIKDNNLKTLSDAIDCDILWDINNGITFCKACHKKYHKEERVKNILEKVSIDGVYECDNGEWKAQTYWNTQLNYLGRFSTKEEAEDSVVAFYKQINCN